MMEKSSRNSEQGLSPGALFNNPADIQQSGGLQGEITVPGDGSTAPPPENIAPRPESIANIASLAPEQQHAALINRAVQYAGTQPRSRAYTAAALPPDHPLVDEVYSELLALPVDLLDRVHLLGDVARRKDIDFPRQERAWDEAVASAEAIGDIQNLGESMPALELVVAAETDNDRLDGVVDRHIHNIVNESSQARVLAAAAKRYLDIAAMGGIDNELAVDTYTDMLARIERLGLADHRALHEAQAYLTRHIMRENPRGNKLEAWTNLAQLPQGIKALGHTAIAIHHEPQNRVTWEVADAGLRRFYASYPPRIKQGIINDLVEVGLFDRAFNLTLQIDDYQRGDHVLRTVARETLLQTARQQATTDPSASAAFKALENAEILAKQILRTLHARQGTEPSEHTNPATNTWAERDAIQTLTEVAATQTAMIVPFYPAQALEATASFKPYEGPDAAWHADMFRGTVSQAFAQAGNIVRAVELADAISDEPDSRAIKSKTYTDIARAVAAQTIAKPAS